MKKFFSLTCIFALLVTSVYVTGVAADAKEVSNKRFIMYYGDWSTGDEQGNFMPDQMPADKFTHLNYAFIDFDENGDLVLSDEQASLNDTVGIPNAQEGTPTSGLLTAFQRLKQKNPNLKIGISLGGWTKSGDFSVVCADDQKRANLVTQVLKFIEYTNMDFVDVDWEYPGNVRDPDLVDDIEDEGTINAGPQDEANYIKLLQDLRNGLDAQGTRLDKTYELSVALSASPYVLGLGTDIAKVFEIVDFANIMTYDTTGAWNGNSGHHTNLYSNVSGASSIEASVRHLLASGAIENKIVIGAAYYTRGWEKITAGTEADPSQPGLYGVAEAAEGTGQKGALNEAPLIEGHGGWRGGIWAYRSLDKLKETYKLVEYWDDVAKAPYLYSTITGAFFTYDNVQSVSEKAKYVNENNLGGMIVWMASQDAPDETGKRNKLSNAIYDNLFGGTSLPVNTNGFTADYSNLDVQVVQSVEGIKVTVKNNAVLVEDNTLIGLLELRQKTIKLPIISVLVTIEGETNPALEAFDDTYLAPGESLTFTLPNPNKPVTVDKVVVKERFSSYDLPFRGKEVPFTFVDTTKGAPQPDTPDNGTTQKPATITPAPATSDNSASILGWGTVFMLSIGILTMYRKKTKNSTI